MPGSTGADGHSATAGFYNDRAGIPEFVNTVQGGGSLTIKHDFGALNFNSITSYRKTHVDQGFDNDSTPVAAVDVLINDQETRTFTQEVQLLSPSSSKISWIVGGFFMRDRSGFDGPIGLGLYGSIAGGTGVLIHGDIDTQSYSGYAEATLPLDDNTKLTGGIRYTHDKRTVGGGTNLVGTNVPGDSHVIFVIAPYTVQPSFSQGQPTWRANISHNFDRDVMVYASYNRGFKSGNFNLTAPSSPAYKAEKIDAYEVGFKAETPDHKLRLNAAAFIYKYKDLQLTQLTGGSLNITNAASANIKGIDVDGQIIATSWLNFRFGGALLDAKYANYTGAQFSVRNPDGTTTIGSGGPQGDLSGFDLTRSPHATANIGAFVAYPVGDGKLKANVNYAYNSGFKWESDNRLKQNAYGLVNAQIGWNAPNDRFSVDVFAKNLTNTKYSVWMVSTTNGDLYAPAAPRLWGAELNFKY